MAAYERTFTVPTSDWETERIRAAHLRMHIRAVQVEARAADDTIGAPDEITATYLAGDEATEVEVGLAVWTRVVLLWH